MIETRAAASSYLIADSTDIWRISRYLHPLHRTRCRQPANLDRQRV